MKSFGVPILVVFFSVFVFESCQGKAFIDPKFLLKGNEGLNNLNKDLNLNLKPGLDLGNMKKDPWPSKYNLNGGSNNLKADIGGKFWQDKNKGLSFDLDLKPGLSMSGNGKLNPSFDALGTFKYLHKDFGFDLDLKPSLSFSSNGKVNPSFDALGTLKYGFWK